MENLSGKKQKSWWCFVFSSWNFCKFQQQRMFGFALSYNKLQFHGVLFECKKIKIHSPKSAICGWFEFPSFSALREWNFIFWRGIWKFFLFCFVLFCFFFWGFNNIHSFYIFHLKSMVHRVRCMICKKMGLNGWYDPKMG